MRILLVAQRLQQPHAAGPRRVAERGHAVAVEVGDRRRGGVVNVDVDVRRVRRSVDDADAGSVGAGFEAEALDHHPEWTNVYNRVEVRLTTHATGGLTDKDIDLARRMEGLGAPPRAR